MTFIATAVVLVLLVLVLLAVIAASSVITSSVVTASVATAFVAGTWTFSTVETAQVICKFGRPRPLIMPGPIMLTIAVASAVVMPPEISPHSSDMHTCKSVPMN